MATPSLRVLLAEQEFSATGLTLRSLCAGAGWSLEMVSVDSRRDLAETMFAHCPDGAVLPLDLLPPDAPGSLRVLHRAYPSIPISLPIPPSGIAVSRASPQWLAARAAKTVRLFRAGLGYRVLSAADGQQALQRCMQETPALAILDPQNHGPAACPRPVAGGRRKLENVTTVTMLRS